MVYSLTKNQVNKILFLLIYWLAAAVFYIFLEMSIEGYTASVYDIYVLDYKYNFTRILFIACSSVLLGGFFLATFEVLYFNKLFRKKPFGTVLLVKSVFYVTGIFIFISVATYISASFILKKDLFHISVLERYIHFLSSPKVWAILVYWSFAVLSAFFILNISDKLGQGVLLNYLLGKYHTPKEENRVFMFLDLISSTEYAEKLGHKKYSMMIKIATVI